MGRTSCNCLSECNSIEYDFDAFYDKTRETNETSQLQAQGSIYFGDDEFVAYRRYESHGRVSLLSNIGGLLGLFLGISLLSIIEIVYFFTLRFLNDLWYKVLIDSK